MITLWSSVTTNLSRAKSNIQYPNFLTCCFLLERTIKYWNPKFKQGPNLGCLGCRVSPVLATKLCKWQKDRQAGFWQNRHWKLGQQNAIRWNYLGLFRDYSLDDIFLGIKLFCFPWYVERLNFQHLFKSDN